MSQANQLQKFLKLKSFTYKNPSYFNLFKSWLNEEPNLNIEALEKEFKIYLNYKSFLKEEFHLSYLKTFKKEENGLSLVEQFHDQLHFMLHKKKKDSFINSLKSNKYIHLFNNEVEKEIHLILDNKISIDALKSQFFNKVARYNTSNELLNGLIDFKNKNVGWNKEYYLNLIKEKNLNCQVEHYGENALMIEVEDYEACKELGSQAWCIVNEEFYFTQYMVDLNRQFIYFDFNKPIEDIESMIGFTAWPDGKIQDSFLKNDDETPQEVINKFSIQKMDKPIIKEKLKQQNNGRAFALICQNGLIDFYEDYIDKVDPSYNYNLAIKLASEYGNLDILEKLLKDDRVEPNPNNFSLVIASQNNHPGIVDRLLKHKKVDPSADENKALIWASEDGSFEVVNRLLQDKRVDPTAQNNSAICLSAERGHIKVVSLLLKDERVNPSDNDNYAIQESLNGGHINIVNLILNDERFKFNLKNDQELIENLKKIDNETTNQLIQKHLNKKNKTNIKKQKT